MAENKINDKGFNEYEKKHTVISKKAKYAGIALISLLGAGGIVTASVVPTVIRNSKGSSETSGREVSIDEAVQHVKCYSKVVNNNLEIYLVVDADYEVTGISKVTINNEDLSNEDYSYANNVVTIKKAALDKHSGKIVVKPTVATASVTSINIESEPLKTGYIVGETVTLADLTNGLLVKAKKGDGTSVVVPSSELSIDMGEIQLPHDIVDEDVGADIPVNITYKDKKVSFVLNAFKQDFSELFKEVGDSASLNEDEVSLGLNTTFPNNIKHLVIPCEFNGKKVKNVCIDSEEHVGKLYQKLYQLESIDFSRATNIIELTGDSGEGVFKNLPNLRKIVLNEGLTFLGDSGVGNFDHCGKLESVYIPSTIESFDRLGDAFNNCPYLKNVFINSTNIANMTSEAYNDEEPYLLKNATNVYVKSSIVVESEKDKYINRYYGDPIQSEYSDYVKYSLGSFVSPNYNQYEQDCSIKESICFNGNVSQTIPETFFGSPVTEIESGAFEDMSIYELILPNSIKEFEGAFNKSIIKKIILNEGLTSIGNCESTFDEAVIGEINIPSSLDNCEASPESVDTVIVDKKEWALTVDSKPFIRKAKKVKVLTEFTQEASFTSSWINNNRDTSVEPYVEGNYTVYTMSQS